MCCRSIETAEAVRTGREEFPVPVQKNIIGMERLKETFVRFPDIPCCLPPVLVQKLRAVGKQRDISAIRIKFICDNAGKRGNRKSACGVPGDQKL